MNDDTELKAQHSVEAGLSPILGLRRDVVALMLAVLWLGGVGSLVAVALAMGGFRARNSGDSRILYAVAAVLGVVGLLATTGAVVSTLLLTESS